MKTLYEIIKEYLTGEPRGRERRNRSRAVVNLLLRNYPEMSTIPKDKLIDFVHDADSYDRIFRKVQQENEDLRGEDYETKDIVEQEKILSLGYEVGYHKDVQQLKML